MRLQAYLVSLEPPHEGIRSAKHSCCSREIATRDGFPNAGASNRGSPSGRLGHRMNLEPMAGAPGTNVWQCSLAGVTKGRFWGKDEPLRRS